MKKLGDAELEIMQVIWEAEQPVTSKYVQQHLKTRSGLPLSSIMATLATLVKKGFVYCDRTTRTNYYSAVIAKQKYQKFENDNLLSRLYDNSWKNLMVNLFQEKVFSKEDIEELKGVLEKYNDGTNN